MPTFRTFPVADLAGAGWSGTGSQLWAQLDDDPSDGDTTYIQAGGDSLQTKTQKFYLQKVGLPDGTIVSSVTISAMCKRLDLGQNVSLFTLRIRLTLGLSTYLLVSQQYNDISAYAALTYASATSPATGQAWTPAEVARLVPTIEVSQSFDNVPRVGAFGRFTQLYADIAYVNPTWTLRRGGGAVIR